MCRECQRNYNKKYRSLQQQRGKELIAKQEMIQLVIKVCQTMQEERDIEKAKVRRKQWIDWEKNAGIRS